MNAKISNANIGKKFDAVAAVFENISNPYTVSRRYGEIRNYLRGNCLEVGAGPGNLVFSDRNKDSYLLTDISYEMCRVAKQKHAVRVVCCDAEKLPFRDRIFDTIILSEVIYYLHDPDAFIKEAQRVMKPNGNLIISTANHDMAFYDTVRRALRSLGIKKMYFDDPVHSFMTVSHLEKLLNRNNFKIKIIKKMILLPFKSLHAVNIMLEKTVLRHFGVFIFAVAEKT